MTDLKYCSRCKCTILIVYFSKNRQGNFYKTCNTCRFRYKCEKCDYKTPMNTNLERHIKQVHDKIKDCECPQCDYKCSINTNLEKHIKQVHDKIKDCECPQCDYKCSGNGTLNRHIKQVHDKIKDCECPQCEFKCSTNSHLKKHIKQVHDKIKDCECPQCDYKCSANDSLKKHIKQVHNKIKDCECPQCDYKCSANESLKKHIKQVHDKIKDFECPQCEFKCSDNSNLKNHIKICTGKLNCSNGEFKIMEVLKAFGLKKDVDFFYDETYDNVRDKGLLRFDFRIINPKTKNMCFIEYDGIFHYKPIRMGNILLDEAKKNLIANQKRDNIKNSYCEKNNIPLHRIPYFEKDKIYQIISEILKN